MLKVVAPSELARDLDPILDSLEQRGTTVIVRRNDQPAALLVRFDAYVAMLATMDYSGWQRWMEEVRAAFPKAAVAPPRVSGGPGVPASAESPARAGRRAYRT